jgi:hypothetical protein
MPHPAPPSTCPARPARPPHRPHRPPAGGVTAPLRATALLRIANKSGRFCKTNSPRPCGPLQGRHHRRSPLLSPWPSPPAPCRPNRPLPVRHDHGGPDPLLPAVVPLSLWERGQGRGLPSLPGAARPRPKGRGPNPPLAAPTEGGEVCSPRHIRMFCARPAPGAPLRGEGRRAKMSVRHSAIDRLLNRGSPGGVACAARAGRFLVFVLDSVHDECAIV